MKKAVSPVYSESRLDDLIVLAGEELGDDSDKAVVKVDNQKYIERWAAVIFEYAPLALLQYDLLPAYFASVK